MQASKTKRGLTFEQAKAQYPERFTLDHVPEWAFKPLENPANHYPAPLYASDAEWYQNTRFAGDEGMDEHCFWMECLNESWPLGLFLKAPYGSPQPTTESHVVHESTLEVTGI